MHDAWERFYLATLALVGPGPIKKRLVGAYLDNLGDLDPTELPEDLRRDFNELSAILNRFSPITDETPVHATVRKMSDQEADQVAEKIVEIYSEVTRTEASAA